MSTPVPGRAAAIAGATSPSRIRCTRAPAARSSTIRSSCRSRSRTTTSTSRLVLLPLADHDDAAHAHRVEHASHAVDGRLVGGLLLATADPPGGGHRSRLRDAHELQRDVAVRCGPPHGAGSYIRSGASTPTR